MPHKRNPILAERLVGMSRIMRGYLVSSLEDVALWHERDISHSSVERVALPDATMALSHMLRTLRRVVEGMEVDEAAMAGNLERRGGVARSQRVLLRLVAAGMERDRAYRLVQQLAASADRPGGDFRASCLASPQLMAALSPAELEEALDIGADLEEAAVAVDQLAGREGSEGGAAR